MSDHFAIPLIREMIERAEQMRPKMADLVTKLERLQLQIPGRKKTRKQLPFNCKFNEILVAEFENMLAPCDDLVSLCRFHPHKPILACALDNGRVCIFAGETPSTPFARWQKRYWKARTNSLIWSLNWNVRNPLNRFNTKFLIFLL